MAIADGAPAGLLPPLASSGAGEWTARRDADIRAVLADPRFTVPPPGPGGPPGTVSWLRASVSRFANGPEHRGRRALVESELARLDPDILYCTARELALAQLTGCGRSGDRADVMSLLARRVPVAALAAQLGLADALRAAAAVTAVAACYFPGSDASWEPAADAGTAWLLAALLHDAADLHEATDLHEAAELDRAADLDRAAELDRAVDLDRAEGRGDAAELDEPAGLDRAGGRDEAADLDRALARIAVMVQACDATAGLIGTALHLLQDSPAAGGRPAGGGGDWPTDVLLAETLRRRPPASKFRRVASADVDVGGQRVRAGERVVCDIEAAGREPAAVADPGRLDPARGRPPGAGGLDPARGTPAGLGQAAPPGTGQAALPSPGRAAPPGLAFGAGLRPCPGPDQALALASGVIDAVRARCVLQPGTPVTYEAAPTRVPERLEVVLR